MFKFVTFKIGATYYTRYPSRMIFHLNSYLNNININTYLHKIKTNKSERINLQSFHLTNFTWKLNKKKELIHQITTEYIPQFDWIKESAYRDSHEINFLLEQKKLLDNLDITPPSVKTFDIFFFFYFLNNFLLIFHHKNNF